MCKLLSPVTKQFLAIFCCNLLTLSYGIANGWATINFNELQRENTTFPTGPLNLNDASLVVSMVNAGGFIGNFAIGPMSNVIGIKRTIHILGPLMIFSSLLTIYAKNVYYLFASKLLMGFVSGTLVIGIPIFINDISYDNVRAAMASLYDPTYNFGIIISFFLGNYLNCLDQVKFQLIVPIVFMVVMFLLPESPEYWLNRNKEKRVIKARKFYKGSIPALDNIEFHEIPIEEKNEKEKLEQIDENETNSKLTLRDFFTPQAKKALFIGFVSLTLSFLSGTLTIISYVTDIFEKTHSSLSEKHSSILVSVVQLTANLLLLNIVERFNRKTLYVCSSFLTSGSFFLFAVYCQFWIDQPEYRWMAPFCFSCITYFSCMGLLPIPYILNIEIFPKKIRQTCLALAVSVMWIILFILGWIFPIILDAIGLVNCMIALAVMSLLNALFGIIFVPETRGKSHEEIMKLNYCSEEEVNKESDERNNPRLLHAQCNITLVTKCKIQSGNKYILVNSITQKRKMCKISPLFKQFLSILCCNLLTFSFGSTMGWSTINFNELQNENSTFPTGPLSLDEASLVVSLINFGGFIGNFIVLPFNIMFGVKRTLHFFGIPLILSALIIIYARNIKYLMSREYLVSLLYLSRILSGIAGGACGVTIPILINDISHDNIRGALNSIYDPSSNLGMIFSFFLGNFLNWLDQAKAQVIVPIIFMIIMFLLPESPEYLKNRNKEKRAIKSHRFYKGSLNELEQAKFLKQKDDKFESGSRANDGEETDSTSKIRLRDFLTTQAKRAMFISFTSLTFNFLTGSLLIISFVTDIFTKTGSPLSAKKSSLLISMTQMIANLVFLNIVERVNRRTLQIGSSILTTIGFFLFAICSSLWLNRPGFEWVPTICFACIVFFSWLGQIPIPFIITTEIFPKKIRQTCLAMAISFYWIILFGLGTVFPIFLETFGLFNCMFILGIMSIINLIFGICFIPETRGKSYVEIMQLLTNK
ncbi:uncharacterized protein LOC116340647 [Contarinia nasturtii]|uniref:uncharacterized protein LOC116340647 n=1 Tax=Contarinia nasturtii TaxID=265458 RepID=UPI0012D422C9|nr:uncharacterized protein LOC116340647 [Contarinia nasturtii]